MVVPLKPMEDTHVELCALIPDEEHVITQPLVFQALLVFPSSIDEDSSLDVFERSQRATLGCGGLSIVSGTFLGDSVVCCHLVLATHSVQLRSAFRCLSLMGCHGELLGRIQHQV